MGKSIIWEEDAALIAAQKTPGWTAFHRACGGDGAQVYFEVERSGKDYTARALRFEKQPGDWYRGIEIAATRGTQPIPAVLAVFDMARAKVDGLTDAMRAHLAPEKQPFEDTIAELIG